jgi:hypothetical protein
MYRRSDYTHYRNGSIIVCIIIIIVFILFFRNNLRETTYVSVGEDALLIQGYKGQEVSIPYGELTRVELTGEVNFGTMINGTDTVRGTSGTWKNDEYGEYSLYINKKVTDYLVLTTDTQTTVFNYESVNVTDNIYTAFEELMNSKELDGQILFVNSTLQDD